MKFFCFQIISLIAFFGCSAGFHSSKIQSSSRSGAEANPSANPVPSNGKTGSATSGGTTGETSGSSGGTTSGTTGGTTGEVSPSPSPTPEPTICGVPANSVISQGSNDYGVATLPVSYLPENYAIVPLAVWRFYADNLFSNNGVQKGVDFRFANVSTSLAETCVYLNLNQYKYIETSTFSGSRDLSLAAALSKQRIKYLLKFKMQNFDLAITTSIVAYGGGYSWIKTLNYSSGGSEQVFDVDQTDVTTDILRSGSNSNFRLNMMYKFTRKGTTSDSFVEPLAPFEFKLMK